MGVLVPRRRGRARLRLPRRLAGEHGAGRGLLAEVARGADRRHARAQARQASRSRCGSHCARLVVEGAPLAQAHADEIADELRVKEVEFGDVDATELRVKPDLRVLGPRLGKELGAVRAALAAGEFEELGTGAFACSATSSSRMT